MLEQQMSLPVQMFLEALGASLKNEQVDWKEPIAPEIWDSMFYLAEHHMVLPMVLEAVTDSLNEQAKDSEILAKLSEGMQKQCVRSVVSQVMRTEFFIQNYRALLDAGVQPLVVKGIVCRSLYPKPDHRRSGDEDILIRPDQYQLVEDVLTGLDMQKADEGQDAEDSYEVPFYDAEKGLLIEVHKHLFPPSSEAYGHWNRYFEAVFDHPAEAVDGTVYTMEPTANLFYLVCHAFKHFLHGGVGMRHVTDILMFAEAFKDEIDFAGVAGLCREIRAEGFTAGVCAIGRTYLNLDANAFASQLPPINDSALEMFLWDIIDAGMMRSNSLDRKHSSTITLRAMAENSGEKTSVLRTVFPRAKDIEGRFDYLKKAPFLLPVAWIQRLYGYWKETRNEENVNPEASVQMGKARVALLEALGAIDGSDRKKKNM